MSDSDSEIAQAGDTIEVDEWRRVSPLSVVAQGVRTIGSAIIPAAFVLFAAARQEDKLSGLAPWLVPILGLIIAINILPAWLNWYRLRYRIGSSDVRLEQGIISRSARSVPYDRIQDVSLEQKLIPRLLGLVEVKFETGAGGKDELTLSYVSEEEGERLREVVRGLVEGADETAAICVASEVQPGEHVSVRDTGDRLLFAMPPQRLLTFGLFSFSLVIFAVLVGVVQQFEFLLPFDVVDYIADYFEDERYAEAGSYISGMDTIARIAGIAWLIASVVLVGLASGVVKTFVRDWEFRLERTAKGFRRRRGLLTKTDVVMPVHRVQALIVSTGLIRRRFGWHGLSFISLAQDSGSANHDVAPFAKMTEIAPIASEAGFTLPERTEEWRRPSSAFYFDRGLIQSLVILLIGLVVFIVAAAEAERNVPGLYIIGAIVAVLISLTAARQYYLWRYDRHALDPEQVLSRRGWLAPRTQIANRVKLHSVEIAQGPLGRWHNYCDLVFGMAGGRFAFRGLALEDAKKLRAAVLDSIASVDFARLPK
ncbi:PH domain-containing protein [Aurantiacibacter sediminis]|uniref:PH domain-containing protein n=1 Tax=Aurantiacibacter sediminis TaxID=2793064 RepID=A0ABS0N0J6_9SPHN|nr:PH domain-containing protein [Aurantiacibacter sediminis]MBH5321488.1 PH domain-containing protein [Aurantiacibacter sediminis]